MKNSILSLLAAIGALAGAEGAVVVRPVNPTWEVVVADDVMNPPAADVDAAPEIQRRIDALAQREGGTLFLRPGTYNVASPVFVRANVTIKGDYAADAPARSTILAITAGEGNEDGEPAFRLDTSSGLQGLFFHYPRQSLAHPTPYSWTVRCTKHPSRAPDNQTIRDCTFVNAWRAISIGPEGNELHTFRDVRICALRTGFHVDSTTDIGRVVDVRVTPTAWSASGLPGAPEEAALRAYLLANDTVGADYGRSDWEYIWRLRVDGYRVGCRFSKGVRGTSNAVMAESSFTRCATGLEVNEVNGVGLAVYDTVFDCTEKSVHLTPRFKTVVQLLACTFAPGAPVNEGGKMSHVLVADGQGAPLRHEPMIWPRPASDRLFNVVDYGASTNAPDNGPAFARALTAAFAAGGGTVYVPGGWYDFRSGFTVPAGVELRGNSATPHHTAAGGSVLMVRFGKGEPDATPFIQLAPGAGLRGLCVWYPESPIYNPDPYPWAVRSLGPECWLADVNIANAWRAVDFLTHPSSGHRIAYLSGVAWHTMLQVGNSNGTGWVEDTLFNPHYSQRLPPQLPHVLGKPPPTCPGQGPNYAVQSWLMRKQLEAHVFKDCADERIRGTFVYAAKEGIAFRGRNRARVLMHGSDTIAHGVEIDQAAGSDLSAALVQVTPYETDSGLESAGFHFAPGDAGTSVFRASQLWVPKPSVIAEGRGRATFEMGNSLSGIVDARTGQLSFSRFRFRPNLEEAFKCAPGARLEQTDSGPFELPDSLNPSAPPVDLAIDFRTVRPLENTIARYGGVRGQGAWFARVEGETYHYKAELKDNAYAYVYAEVLKDVAIPVHTRTRLKYRVKPLTANVFGLATIAFDFHFTDGSIMRTSPNPSWPAGNAKVGEWNDVSLWLSGSIGKTIDRVMLRLDRRHTAAGVYEALFDSIRFVTPSKAR